MPDWIDRLRVFHPTTLFRGWWVDVRYVWSTHNKGGLLLFGVVTAVAVGFGSLITHLIGNRTEDRDLMCLALNVYHEARGEPMSGQYAVAEVTMNRVASRHYPNTVCGVVYQKNWDPKRKRYVSMFSWTEIDDRPDVVNNKLWNRAWKAASEVYHQIRTPRLKGALFYHASYIRPRWSHNKRRVARIGRHIFYR